MIIHTDKMKNKQKLKTLKDIELGGHEPYDLKKKEKIKQEAIKWVKWNDYNGTDFTISRGEFMDIFNITEEDLE